MATKDSKLEILRNYWEKNLNKVMLNATMQKDEDVVALCKLIMKIPKLVQVALLRHYIAACRALHAIAFFQWRQSFPSSV
tara:strand:+ start:154 stop:393 length:240 start_codon:yes stop_codon:yes gene_type:complete